MAAFLLFLVVLCPLSWSSENSSISKLEAMAQKEEQSQAQKPEIRVLVENAALLKSRDPQNLRTLAFKRLMLAIAQSSHVSLWAYGRGVKTMIPMTPLDHASRLRAIQIFDTMAWDDTIVDLGGALHRALQEWDYTKPRGVPMILLVGDGTLHVSPRQSDNDIAMQHILKELAPKIKDRNIRLLILPLTRQAHTDFLKQLAKAAGSPPPLKPLLLEKDDPSLVNPYDDLFKTNGWPVEQGRLLVGSEVKELTLFVPHPDRPGALRLENPQGEVIEVDSHASGVQWLHEPKLDLVNIVQPMPGFWRLLNHHESKQKALVFSDLKLVVRPIRDPIFVSESVRIAAELQEAGRKLSQSQFLDQLRLSCLIKKPGEEKGELLGLNDQGYQGDTHMRDSVFGREWSPTANDLGPVQMICKADNRVMQRMWRQNITVAQSPVLLKAKVEEADVIISVIAQEELVNPASLHGTIDISDAEGTRDHFKLKPYQKGKPWQFSLKADRAPYRFEPHLLGETLSGRSFDLKVAPYTLTIQPGASPSDVSLQQKLPDARKTLRSFEEEAQGERLSTAANNQEAIEKARAQKKKGVLVILIASGGLLVVAALLMIAGALLSRSNTKVS